MSGRGKDADSLRSIVAIGRAKDVDRATCSKSLVRRVCDDAMGLCSQRGRTHGSRCPYSASATARKGARLTVQPKPFEKASGGQTEHPSLRDRTARGTKGISFAVMSWFGCETLSMGPWPTQRRGARSSAGRLPRSEWSDGA